MYALVQRYISRKQAAPGHMPGFGEWIAAVCCRGSKQSFFFIDHFRA